MSKEGTPEGAGGDGSGGGGPPDHKDTRAVVHPQLGSGGVQLRFGAKRGLKTILAVLGPAWIVMMADVDAPSVITAGESGAAYGYHLVFVLLILIVPLFFIQEASGRLGVATGKGLAEVVRDGYSQRMAMVTALPMFVTDFLSYTVEYTGAAVAL
ncbi:MAG: divalent metal cation transporter, partial [Nitrososphaerota archaeon]|nr:divalent metal cation transporter [Nitrososphaerota archaeon]